MRDEEERDRERAYVLKQIEALKVWNTLLTSVSTFYSHQIEELETQKSKKLAAARLMNEVNEANRAAMKSQQ